MATNREDPPLVRVPLEQLEEAVPGLNCPSWPYATHYIMLDQAVLARPLLMLFDEFDQMTWESMVLVHAVNDPHNVEAFICRAANGPAGTLIDDSAGNVAGFHTKEILKISRRVGRERCFAVFATEEGDRVTAMTGAAAETVTFILRMAKGSSASLGRFFPGYHHTEVPFVLSPPNNEGDNLELEQLSLLPRGRLIQVPQQRAFVQSCRTLLVTGRCGLENGGQGLVDAIEQQIEKEQAIHNLITSLSMQELAQEKVRFFCASLPNKPLADLQLLHDLALDDEQTLRLFSLLHTQEQRIMLKLTSGLQNIHERPRSFQFLVQQISAALLAGETSMQWLEIPTIFYEGRGFRGRSRLAEHQCLITCAMRDAVNRSNNQLDRVAAIETQIRQGPFPFTLRGSDLDIQQIREHASAALINAVTAYHANAIRDLSEEFSALANAWRPASHDDLRALEDHANEAIRSAGSLHTLRFIRDRAREMDAANP